MAQRLKRWALYAALATGLIACASAMAFILLCGLTPTVTVYNKSQWQLEAITVDLPSKQLHFNNLAPGQDARAFYDAKQPDGNYHISVRRNGVVVETDCGYVTQGEWGKRVHVTIDDKTIDCREQLHY